MAVLRLIVIAIVVVAAVGAGESPRTGRFTLTFSERSPLSWWVTFRERMGATYSLLPTTAEPREAAYDITQEPFDVYVPPSYDASVPYGLIAWVNSGNGGMPPGRYADVCDKHKLIWIGGAQIPNDRPTWTRMRLTIDGIHNLRATYRIDPNRIYGMGQSGGGRVTSLMAVPYTDVFSGGAIPLIGCNPFTLPTNQTVAARIDALARTRRFVFITGATDYNKPDTMETHAAYAARGFPHILYLEQPDLGHATPAADWFERAMVFVDTPAIAQATAQLTLGTQAEARQAYLEAYSAYHIAAQCAVAEDTVSSATAALARLLPLLDEQAATALAQLGDKPSGVAIRQFLATWPSELPTSSNARARAEHVANDDFTRLGPKPSSAALRSFLTAWDGYEICERAVVALDEHAKRAWPKTAAVKPGPARWRALAQFTTEWSPTPTAARAAQTSADEIAVKVADAEALATDGARLQRLKLLYVETRTTPAQSVVQTALIAVLLRMEGDGESRKE